MPQGSGPQVIEQPPTGTLEAGSLASFTTFAFGWLLLVVASLRVRVFPRGAAILLIAGSDRVQVPHLLGSGHPPSGSGWVDGLLATPVRPWQR